MSRGSVESLNETLESKKRLKVDATREAELLSWVASVIAASPAVASRHAAALSACGCGGGAANAATGASASAESTNSGCGTPATASLQTLLKSGAVLCDLVNILSPGIIPKVNYNNLAFKQMENIEAYLGACRRMGIPNSSLFNTLDLFENKDIFMVMANLDYLKQLAVKHGNKIPTTIPLTPSKGSSGKLIGSMSPAPAPAPLSPSIPLPKNNTASSLRGSSSAPLTTPTTSTPPVSSKLTVPPNPPIVQTVVPPVTPSPPASQPAALAAVRPSVSSLEDDIRVKEEFKYCAELEVQAKNWICEVLDEPNLFLNKPFAPALKSGVILCNLMNKLKPDLIPKISTSNVNYLQMENINSYLRACSLLGLPRGDLFTTVELFEGKNMNVVINNVHVLAKFVYKQGLTKLAIKDSSHIRTLFSASLNESTFEDFDEQEDDTSADVTFDTCELLEWANKYLGRLEPPRKLFNLSNDFRTGVKLLKLFEVLTKESFSFLYDEKPRNLWQCMQNASLVMRIIEQHTFCEITCCTAQDVVMGNTENIMHLLELLRDKYDMEYLFFKLLNEGQSKKLSAVEIERLQKIEESQPDTDEYSSSESDYSEDDVPNVDMTTPSNSEEVQRVEEERRNSSEGMAEETPESVEQAKLKEEEAKRAEEHQQAVKLKEELSQQEAELAKQQEAEVARQKEAELARQRQAELEEQISKQRQQEAEMRRREEEVEKQREARLLRQREEELANQRQALLRQQEAELKQREEEVEKQREARLLRQREEERARQREAELTRQRDAELAKQRELELAKQQEAELASLKHTEFTKQQESECANQQVEEIHPKDVQRQEEEQRWKLEKEEEENRKREEEKRIEEAKREEEVKKAERKAKRRAAREAKRKAQEETEVNSPVKEVLLEPEQKVQEDAEHTKREEKERRRAERRARRKAEAESRSKTEVEMEQKTNLESGAPQIPEVERQDSSCGEVEARREEENGKREEEKRIEEAKREEEVKKQEAEIPGIQPETEVSGIRQETEARQSEQETVVQVRHQEESTSKPKVVAEALAVQQEGSRQKIEEVHVAAKELPSPMTGESEIKEPEDTINTRAKEVVNIAEQSPASQPSLALHSNTQQESPNTQPSSEVPNQKLTHQRHKTMCAKEGKEHHRPSGLHRTGSLAPKEFPRLRNSAQTVPPPSQLGTLQQQQDEADRERMLNAQSAVRQCIATELMQTEKSYLTHLCTVAETLLPEATTTLTSKEVYSLFANWSEIVGVHKQLLTALSDKLSSWSPTTTIGDVFLIHGKNFLTYGAYLKNYCAATVSLHYLKKKNAKFATQLAEFERRQTETHFDLGAFLIMPVQRLPRYLLLLENMQKYTGKLHPDHTLLAEAHQFVLDTTNTLNAGIDPSVATHARKLVSIAQTLTGEETEALVVAGRKLVREGNVSTKLQKMEGATSKSKPPRHKNAPYLYLFSDLLLYCDQIKNPKDGRPFSVLTSLKLDRIHNVVCNNTKLELHMKPGAEGWLWILENKNPQVIQQWSTDIKSCQRQMECTVQQS
ncbi:transgelin [Pelomyxa schiedti]|nr:transgelin [Pelomyxa schiedti]